MGEAGWQQLGSRQRRLVDAFHKLYYMAGFKGGTWTDTRWFGTPVQKCPLDLWIYQEILHELRPDLVIETGTADGGSASYMASIMDLLGKGRIVTVDIEARQGRPHHSRIQYVHGSSIAPEVHDQIRKQVEGASTVMVILDSDHTKGHVLQEMELFAPMVSKGSYMIVEDTNVNGHPVKWSLGLGPMEAVREFLPGHKDFEIDLSRQKFYLTMNPDGFLRKLA